LRHDALVPSVPHLRNRPDREEWVGLANDPEADPDVLRSLVGRSKRVPGVVRPLAANPQTPPDALRRLGKHSRWDVRALVAANPSADAKTLDQLACDDGWAIAVALAARPDIPSRLLRGSEYWTGHERFALAGNPNVPVEALDRLLEDDNVYVRGRAASNPSARPESLRALVQSMSESPWVLRAAAANPACPPDLADEVLTWIALGGTGAGDPTFDPVACVGNPVDASTPEYFFYQNEAKEPDAYESVLARVRASVLGANRTVPVRVMEVLAHDAEPSVRTVAATVRELPRDVLEELVMDADPQVARNATVALNQHNVLIRSGRRSKSTRVLARIAPVAIGLTLIQVVNGMGHGGGGGSSDPSAALDQIDSRPPTVITDADVIPPATETSLTGGARVRSGFAANHSDVRLWFDAGSRALTVDQLEVRTIFGHTFRLDGFVVPAKGANHLVLLPVGISAISSVVVDGPGGSIPIRIH